MNKKFRSLFFAALLILSSIGGASAQTTTGSISGTVTDQQQAVVGAATVTARNTDTGLSRTNQTDGEGRYNFVNLPIGAYEITVEAANFSKYVQTGITLLVNQAAVVDVALKAGNVQEVVTVTENASLLNTTTSEVSTRFDERRLSELPIAANRSVYNVLLSVPGVSALGSGQTGFANGISFSSNGGRLRSNNFMLDGQDINDPSVSGGQIAINNPDAIGEVRIITNQFLPEFGRNSGSVVNFIGKSGTNEFHGSGFVFHNNERLNACSNLNKRAGFCNPDATIEERRRAPFRKDFQYGFTFGGPLTFLKFGEGGPTFFKAKDRTFFFGDFQRGTERQLGSGFTLRGAPTVTGRAVLQQFASSPQVAALLNFIPAGTPNGTSQSFTVGGQTFTVPLGDLTGSSSGVFNDNQGSIRIDHRISDKNLLYGRYRANTQEQTGGGQVTPPGLTTVVQTKTQAATLVLNSILTSRVSNEARIAWTRFDSSTNAQDPSSETIPSIEISQLQISGFNAAANRTAIGLAVNLPQFRINDTYQIQDSISYTTGNHNLKFGIDARRTDVKSFFFPTVRGRLAYTSLDDFVNDRAQTATITLPLRGGDIIGFYRWYEFYAFGQDEWRVTPNLTLTYGARYEYPGDSFGYLKDLNERVLAANGNNPAFRFDPNPQVDKNNLMPRVGFNYNPRTSGKGFLGLLTGGDKTVFRGGYARTYDANFVNINLNVFSSFPFVASQSVSTTNAFVNLRNTTVPNVAQPNRLARTIVSGDFRAPATDQFSLEMQRELFRDAVMKVGFIRTRGTGLFQTVDGNPCRPGFRCDGTNFGNRVDPTRETLRLRTNSAQSTYDALQVSFDKRLSNSFSAGFHYTYSSFIDDASELFNPSTGEVAVSQDSFNRAADRARSTYDRPHRFSGNFVYELPFFKNQRGFVGRMLGGFQINSFFSIQSGAPFTVLNGADPAFALSGIDGLVGNAIRPNVYTNEDVSSMSIPDLYALNLQLRNQAITQAQQIFAALPPINPVTNPCVAGPLGGPALNNTLFTTSVGRTTCTTSMGQTTRGLVLDFIGLPSGRVGNAGRNILRADSIRNVDFGIIKNTRIFENVRVQLRADMFNVLNERNFGIPSAVVTQIGVAPVVTNAASFLDQWGTDGTSRRIVLGARIVF